MRSRALFGAAATLAAILSGSGCSLPGSHLTPSDAPQAFTSMKAGKLPNDLFVTDDVDKAVEILANGTWKNVGQVSKGLSHPWSDWVDKQGNIYVTATSPSGQPKIEEWRLGDKSPIFTYTSGLTGPVSVTTDANGNVYEADYNGHYVLEYPQKEHTAVAKCTLGADDDVTGVAVNASGAVFADYRTANYTGRIVEYKAGLHGCHQTMLHPKFEFPYGIVVDAHGDLVLADADSKRVYIVDPPFKKITKTWGTIFTAPPMHVTINAANTQAYVTEAGTDVRIVGYPGGMTITTLGQANGIHAPYAAVDGDNFVP